ANFTGWARSLLDALSRLWAALFGGWRRSARPQREAEAGEEALPPRPFTAFSNPFADGTASGRTPRELVRYTLAAFQPRGAERDLGRQPGETALEFADRVGGELPALEPDALRLALLFAQAAYARGELPGDCLEALERFWERLETVIEQPLSA